MNAPTAAPALDAPLAEAFGAVGLSWQQVIGPFVTGLEGRALCARVDARVAAGAVVFPPHPLRALQLTPLDDVKVVVLGQDPYHGAGQAEGLAFSVPAGVRPPPSLRNIFKELQRDLGLPAPATGSLTAWAGRGVLLLNTTLTVEAGRPGSHGGFGWELLTERTIDAVVARRRPTVFLLWGAWAQAQGARIKERAAGAHLLLEANHPSPLSATRPPKPFIGCGHFGRAAAFLADRGRPISWAL